MPYRILLLLPLLGLSACVTGGPPPTEAQSAYAAAMATQSRATSYAAFFDLKARAKRCIAATETAKALPHADPGQKWPAAGGGEMSLAEMQAACEKLARLEGVETAFEGCTRKTMTIVQDNATAETKIDTVGKAELRDCKDMPRESSFPASYRPIQDLIRRFCAGGVAAPGAALWETSDASRSARYFCWQRERRERWTDADLP